MIASFLLISSSPALLRRKLSRLVVQLCVVKQHGSRLFHKIPKPWSTSRLPKPTKRCPFRWCTVAPVEQEGYVHALVALDNPDDLPVVEIRMEIDYIFVCTLEESFQQFAVVEVCWWNMHRDVLGAIVERPEFTSVC